MLRILVLAVVASLLCCLVATSVSADRLILIPTASTMAVGGIRAEYAANADSDGEILWANVGLSALEVEYARFAGFGPNDVDSLSGQISVVPETLVTPGVAVGARDIANDTEGRPYDGRAFYAVASKNFPVTGGVPAVFEDVRLHAGLGTGSLEGVFLGVEGTLPMGLRLAAEYDTDEVNVAASYRLIPALSARVYSIKGDVYYGAVFALSF